MDTNKPVLNMALSPSLIRYLLAFYPNGDYRSAVAERMKVSKPSVTNAVHALMDSELVFEDRKTRAIIPTERGLAEAKKVTEITAQVTKALIADGMPECCARTIAEQGVYEFTCPALTNAVLEGTCTCH